MKSIPFALSLVMLSSFSGGAAENFTSKYQGEEKRRIKSLSQEDISELKAGGGWGLAKAAELNGMPGPAHLLEMAAEIRLTQEQQTAIQALFDEMQGDAKMLGNQLVKLEGELNQRFAEGSISPDSLTEIVGEIERVRAALRIVHLSTHLKTPDVLSPHQIAQYNQLRGYDSDPCLNVPKGHNEEMWKKHNGCQ